MAPAIFENRGQVLSGYAKVEVKSAHEEKTSGSKNCAGSSPDTTRKASPSSGSMDLRDRSSERNAPDLAKYGLPTGLPRTTEIQPMRVHDRFVWSHPSTA